MTTASAPELTREQIEELRHELWATNTLAVTGSQIDALCNAALRSLSAPAAEGALNSLARNCHAANQHWWHHPVTGERLDRNKGELLMLIVSEVSECMEGERKGLMDDHLPHRKMAEVELADVLIRVFDYAGAYGYDLDGAVAEKRAYNANRADHKADARLKDGGKKW